jgi:hypothetical protein
VKKADRAIGFGRTIFACLCLLVSTSIPAIYTWQDEDKPIRRCIDIGPFESHIEACLLNRISQLTAELELDLATTKRLRVVANGVLKKEANRRGESFYYGNPLHSKFWKSNLDRVLDEEQIAKLAVTDEANSTRRDEAKQQYNQTPNVAFAKADFVATNLQFHLYLTRDQTTQVRKLLQSHLEEIGDENWEPRLEPFFEANQEQLESFLSESQLMFFDGKSLINGFGDQAVWNDEWRKATCTDCHALP